MTATPESSASYVAPDLLSDSLALLRIRGHVGSRTEARGRWGLQLPTSDSYFHLIEHGACFLQLNGGTEAVRLAAGDSVILPHGNAHRLTDAPGGNTVTLEQALEQQRDGIVRLGLDGSGEGVGIVCGAFRFDGGPGHPLLEALPAMLHVPATQGADGGHEDMVRRFLIDEVREPHLGAEAIVSRLVELLFIQTVRRWIANQPASTSGWLFALRHPVLKVVLRHIHTAPDRPWTVTDLAREAGVSRSALSALFSQMVGQSPMAYLARWRLLLAARLLRDEGLTVGRAAERVGYEAEAAFSRAFKRQFGVAPATYRQRDPRAAEAGGTIRNGRSGTAH